MTNQWVQSQLDAGGIVDLDSQVDTRSTETIVARTYGGPILGDRVIVKLTSDRLTSVEDLTMEFLGLQGQQTSQPLGLQNRTALEFGQWALIHQPKNAKYALDLVKRMRGAERKALSKPGHAWEAYLEMAEELNRSVRNFLPPFWEQAARAYKNTGNTSYAGRALSKALEAERVHSLPVDRAHRRDAILEFTLSGCLTGKALSEYGKDLEKQFPPLEAYETYKDLTIRRTLGGVAPIASAATELGRMAKAAKLDVDAEIEAVLEAIIPSPAMARTPLAFWKSVSKPIARIVQRNADFGMWLLAHTNPMESYQNENPIWEWIDMLDRWAVLELLERPEAQLPKSVEISGGRSGWFSRLASVESSPNKWVFELLERLTQVLQTENKPLELAIGRLKRQIDVDLLDMALEKGLQVSIPKSQFSLNFDGWFRQSLDHPRRHSPLNNLFKEPLLRRKLVEQITEVVQFKGENKDPSWGRKLPTRRSFEDLCADHKNIQVLWWEFIDQQLVSLETSLLADFEIAQEKLSSCCRSKVGEYFPKLAQRLQAIDAKSCFHRTLRAGLLDEYGWDTLDTLAEVNPLPSTARNREEVFWVFPNVAWYSKDTLHCASPGETRSWELLLARGQSLRLAIPIGSRMAFFYTDEDQGWRSFFKWSSDPQKAIELPGFFFGMSHNHSRMIQVSQDAVFTGERLFRHSDTNLPSGNAYWFYDGQRYWVDTNRVQFHRSELDEGKIVEIDPLSGKTIRQSIPPFFEEPLPSGASIHWPACFLLPKPDQTGPSPLGEKNGMLGLRCIRRRDGAFESTSIDGRSWAFTQDEQPVKSPLYAVGILNKPASDSFWIAANDGRLIDSESRSAMGLYQKRKKYYAGSASEFPVLFLSLLQVRCEKTSKSLRNISQSDSDKLFHAAKIQREARDKKEDPNSPDPARELANRTAQELFPDAPSKLLQGIVGIASVIADVQAAIDGLIARLSSPPTPNAKPVALPSDNAEQGFKALWFSEDLHRYAWVYHDPEFVTHLETVKKFFSGNSIDALPKTQHHWFSILYDCPRVLWRSFWSQAIREDAPASVPLRLAGPWLDALKYLSGSGLLDLDGHFGLFKAQLTRQSDSLDSTIRKKLESSRTYWMTEGDTRYIAYNLASYSLDEIYILGYNPTHACQAPSIFTVETGMPFKIQWRSDHLSAFVDQVEKLKSLPLPSPQRLEQASARLGLQPISIALLWMANLRTNPSPYGQEKLTKELRDHYGWKVKDIQTAIGQLQAIAIPQGLFSKCLSQPGDLTATMDQNFDAMVDALAQSKEQQSILPPELIQEFKKSFNVLNSLPQKEFNELLLAPEDASLLMDRKLEFVIPKDRRTWAGLQVQWTPDPSFSPLDTYEIVIRGLSIANYCLPVGHPVRKRLPDAIEAIRDFFDRPETMLPIISGYLPIDSASTTPEKVVRYITPLGAKIEKDDQGVYRCQSDRYKLASVPPVLFCYANTAMIRQDKDYQAILGELQPIWSIPNFAGRLLNAESVLKIRSEAFSKLCSFNRQPNLPEGSWEQNAMLSVPELVHECSKQLQIEAAGATLYLQILALPDPTTSNIKQWNGWSTKQLQTAAAQLLEKGLVVQAKRERAGREYFLPGGWEPLKAPNLPIESWKLALFGYQDLDPLRGGFPERIVVDGPVCDLFHAAWKRRCSGDIPAYQDAPVKPKSTKKK